jgi:molybdate transport repressor ModE-like protein/molybdopterin-binding protein
VRHRTDRVSSSDLALLAAVARERSVVRASRSIGMSRDRAVYRLERLARAFGGPVVRGARGGTAHGGTALTPLGGRVARGGFDSVELLDARRAGPTPAPNLLRGVYRARPYPRVELGRSLELRVAFSADDGSDVALRLDPEAILVARERFPSSARNVLPARVEGLRRGPGELERTLLARCGRVRLRVAVTDEPVRQLGLVRGTPVWLYVKATALRRVVRPGPARLSRGRPRSTARTPPPPRGGSASRSAARSASAASTS